MSDNSKSKHTPGPWTHKHPVYYADNSEHILAPMPGQEGAIIASYITPENAEYIVRCVNSHEALINLLREVKRYVGTTDCPGGTVKRIEEALKQAGEA